MNRRLAAALGTAALIVAVVMPTAVVAREPGGRDVERVDRGVFGKVDPRLVKSMLGGGDRAVNVIIELEDKPVALLTADANAQGRTLTKAEKAVLRSQLKRTQDALKTGIRAAGGKVQRQYQDAYNGIKVRASTRDLAKLARLPGVVAVRAIPKVYRTLSNAVPRTGVPGVWGDYGYTGAGVKIAIIDTGIDYTHADFGGEGTPEAFAANDGTIIEDGTFPTTKVAGGWDFVGDDYDPDSDDPDDLIPQPDADPLDCEGDGHGTHVAGIAAGQGVDADGATYDGPYHASVDFGQFRVGPGVAPEATLYAYRVFGCEGGTEVVVDAIDAAVAAGVDVINMSLGSDLGEGTDPDAVAADNAAKAGVTVVISAGNSGPVPFVVGSPGTSTRAITVAAQDTTASFPLATVELPDEDDQDGLNMNGAALPVSADLIVLRNDDDSISLGCDADAYGGTDVEGMIVAIKRGECALVDKGAAADAAGAAGIILVNRDDADPEELGLFLGYNPDLFDIPLIGVANGSEAAILASDGEEISLVDAGTDPNPTYGESADFTSSGPRHTDNALKPDISAPGVNILSALAASGDDGTQFSGTSMASPYTAGAAALVIEAHPSWSAARVKAALVNTAIAGDVVGYDPLLAGSGGIRPRRAVSTSGLASVAGGTSSLSFGYVSNDGPIVQTKKIRIDNVSGRAITYDLSASFVGGRQGASISFDRRTVRVPAHGHRNVTVTIRLSRADVRNLPDAAAFGDGTAINTIRGAITANPRGRATGKVNLRVPFLLVPRGESDIRPGNLFGQATSSGISTAKVRVKNHGVHAGIADIYAWGQYDQNDGEAKTDIRAVGVQSIVGSEVGLDPDDRLLIFAVNFWSTYSTASDLDLEVEIDTDQDGSTDFYLVGFDSGLLFGGEFDGATYSLLFDAAFELVDIWPVVAPMNGSTYQLMTAASSLGLSDGAAAFDYDTFAYPVILGGFEDSASGVGHFDAYTPAVSQNDYVLLSTNETVKVTLAIDRTAYIANPAHGWMIVANDDADGRAQANLIHVWDVPIR